MMGWPTGTADYIKKDPGLRIFFKIILKARQTTLFDQRSPD